MDWHDLIEDVRIELGLLHQLDDESSDLVSAITTGRDGPTEHLAAGAALQSFYGGVEKTMTLIAERVDDGWDRGTNARRALLEAMCHPTDNRPALLGDELADVMRRYMEFREAFRYAQFFHLDWTTTAPLVKDLPRVLGVFETCLDQFFTDAAGQPAALTEQPAELPRYWSRPVKVKTVRLEKKPAIIMCVVMMAIGGITGFVMTKNHYGPWKPQVIPANVIEDVWKVEQRSKVGERIRVDKVFKAPAFVDPAGQTVQLTFRDRKKPFLVTVGKVLENSAVQFTGRVVRKGATPRSRPVLGVDFHEGKPIFFQVVTDDGRFERGILRDGIPLRFTLCQPDGLPTKTYHITSNGQTACVIERGQFFADEAGTNGYKGWYYRFYHEGRHVARLFMTDDGLLLESALWGLDVDPPKDGNKPATRPGGKTP